MANLLKRLLTWLDSIVNPIVNQSKQPMESKPQSTPTIAPEAPASPVVKRHLIQPFCDAINKYEGDKPSRHNPGAIRCPDNDKNKWHHLAISSDNNFCDFKDEADGMTALVEVVTNVCNGVSATYNFEAMKKFSLSSCADLTITQYFIIRDPSTDNNDPEKYAAWVCKKLNILTTMTMKELP